MGSYFFIFVNVIKEERESWQKDREKTLKQSFTY
jgi:hypothetical protein